MGRLRYTSSIMKDHLRSLEMIPQEPILMRLGGRPIVPGLHVSTPGTAFTVDLTRAANDSTRAYILKTQLDSFESMEDGIAARDGEVIDLGDIPSLIATGDKGFSTNLDDNSMHDIFTVHNGMFQPSRISTDENTPHDMTFDELKILISVKTGLTPEELKGISGTVIADKVSMRNRQNRAYYGIEVDNMVATISSNTFSIFFVDRNDFWRVPTQEDFRQHLLQRKP